MPRKETFGQARVRRVMRKDRGVDSGWREEKNRRDQENQGHAELVIRQISESRPDISDLEGKIQEIVDNMIHRAKDIKALSDLRDSDGIEKALIELGLTKQEATDLYKWPIRLAYNRRREGLVSIAVTTMYQKLHHLKDAVLRQGLHHNPKFANPEVEIEELVQKFRGEFSPQNVAQTLLDKGMSSLEVGLAMGEFEAIFRLVERKHGDVISFQDYYGDYMDW